MQKMASKLTRNGGGGSLSNGEFFGFESSSEDSDENSDVEKGHDTQSFDEVLLTFYSVECFP